MNLPFHAPAQRFRYSLWLLKTGPKENCDAACCRRVDEPLAEWARWLLRWRAAIDYATATVHILAKEQS